MPSLAWRAVRADGPGWSLSAFLPGQSETILRDRQVKLLEYLQNLEKCVIMFLSATSRTLSICPTCKEYQVNNSWISSFFTIDEPVLELCKFKGFPFSTVSALAWLLAVRLTMPQTRQCDSVSFSKYLTETMIIMLALFGHQHKKGS